MSHTERILQIIELLDSTTDNRSYNFWIDRQNCSSSQIQIETQEYVDVINHITRLFHELHLFGNSQGEPQTVLHIIKICIKNGINTSEPTFFPRNDPSTRYLQTV